MVLFDLCRAACERVAAPVRVSPAVVDVASGERGSRGRGQWVKWEALGRAGNCRLIVDS